MRAIETTYKGYRFRSRLEARWAVFFDVLGVEWEYEVQGFVLSDGTAYLPDFWLPRAKLWVEIKAKQEHDDPNRLFGNSMKVARDGESILLLVGSPWLGEYDGFLWLYGNPACDGGDVFVVALTLCRRCDALQYLTCDGYTFGSLGPCCDADRYPVPDDSRVLAAYRAAREARFEHEWAGAKAMPGGLWIKVANQ